jgi:rare lipoprotein A
MSASSNMKTAFAVFVTVICLSQLTSCGTLHQKNGVYENIDITAIPDAVPKPEPLSAVGNKSVYKVKGHTYKALKDAKSYNKVGIASWYGPQFQGQLTSNNDSYNMYAMTAASRDLPLPSYVSVTNLENGRNVILKVNDRGPFVKYSRVMDVSYVAARKLGFAEEGIAKVRVTIINVNEAQQQLARNNTSSSA